MAGYVDYPLTVDIDRIVADSIAQLQTALGVTLNEGDPLVAALEVVAYRNAETRLILTDFAAAAFRDFGSKLVGVAAVGSAPATVESTWTVADDDGYTIPAGTIVLYEVTGDQHVALQTVVDTTIPPGSTSATGVLLSAVVEGADANGLPAATVQLVDPLTWITSVATTGTTAGGADAETSGEYLDRLVAELRLLTRVPVRPGDYSTAARSVAGVHRALVINLYDADTNTPDSEGHVTVVPVDAAGAALDAPTKAEVEAALTDDGARLTNVVVHVEDPTPVPFDVDFTVTAAAGADPAVVEAAAIAALNAALDPAVWAGGADDPPVWRDEPVVRWLDLVGLLYDVDGVAHVDALTIDAAAADLDMSAGGTVLAPLPDATVTGTAT